MPTRLLLPTPEQLLEHLWSKNSLRLNALLSSLSYPQNIVQGLQRRHSFIQYTCIEYLLCSKSYILVFKDMQIKKIKSRN
jgi:hypothetical protein